MYVYIRYIEVMAKTKKKNYMPKKHLRKLTDKQRAYVRERVANPTKSKVSAVFKSHDVTKATNAGAMAAQLERNPKVQAALAAYSGIAEETIVQAIADFKDSDKQWQRTLAVDTSKWVHDKLHGKATQRSENLNLNFSEHVQEKGYKI
jgi:hypothetical protein